MAPSHGDAKGIEPIPTRQPSHRPAYLARVWKVRVWPVTGMLTV